MDSPHISNPLVLQKILARIMLSEIKTSWLFIFLLSSCDVAALKAGPLPGVQLSRPVFCAAPWLTERLEEATSRWLVMFFFLNSNDVLDAVLSADLGEQRCFKFLTRQLVSLDKTKIICSVVDRKPLVACGFCGAKISSVIGYNTINVPDIFQVFKAI